MPDTTRAPWTPEQVRALNKFQGLWHVHPFTCPTDDCKVRTLTASPEGWICLGCGYRQDWAHSFMADEAYIDRLAAAYKLPPN